jgi:hypothetical protein
MHEEKLLNRKSMLKLQSTDKYSKGLIRKSAGFNLVIQSTAKNFLSYQ